jgi:hypothetical protein
LPNDTTHYQKENPMNLIQMYQASAQSAADSCPEGGTRYAAAKWFWFREEVAAAVIASLIFAVLRGAEICGVHPSVTKGAIGDAIVQLGPIGKNGAYLTPDY